MHRLINSIIRSVQLNFKEIYLIEIFASKFYVIYLQKIII